MIKLYDRVAPTVPGPLGDEMRGHAAEVLMTMGRRTEARQRFDAMLRAGAGAWMIRANLRVAEMDLRDRRPDACLTRIRALLAYPEADRKTLLVLMSKAYENKGEFDKAALALGGEIPPQ